MAFVVGISSVGDLMITVEVIPDASSPAITMLTNLDLKLSPGSMAAFLKNFVVEYLQGVAGERFDTEGDEAVGGKWVPLKESTLRIRADQGLPAGPINYRTGELRNFVTGSEGSIGIDIGATLEWPSGIPEGGNLMFKYKTAQTGTSNGKVPARPTVGIGFQDMAAINLMLGGFIDAGKR